MYVDKKTIYSNIHLFIDTQLHIQISLRIHMQICIYIYVYIHTHVTYTCAEWATGPSSHAGNLRLGNRLSAPEANAGRLQLRGRWEDQRGPVPNKQALLLLTLPVSLAAGQTGWG